MLDIEGLLVELSGETLCGNDEEFSTLFIEMETAEKGREEREMAGSVIEAEPPDWRLVKKNALVLAKKTHDLRVAVSLISALLNLHGFKGLEEGSRLLVGMIEKYWPCLHPELDIDDGDAIARINGLRILCDTSFYLMLKKQPLVEVRGIGRFTLNDVQGKANKDGKVTDTALINAAFENCDAALLQATVASVTGSLVNINRINELLQEKAAEDNTLDFTKIVKTLKEIEQLLATHLQQQGGGSHASEEVQNPITNGVLSANSPATHTNSPSPEFIRPQQISGEINNTDDVIKMLDKINTYYKNNEPSSPVPLLLDRAKRLVNKDFKQLLEDLSPKTIKELEIVFGADKAKRK